MRSPLPISLALGLVAGAVAAPEASPLYDVRHGDDLSLIGRQRLDGDVFTPGGLVRVGNSMWVAAHAVQESAGDGKAARGQAYLFEYNSYGERLQKLEVGGRRRFMPRGLSSDGDRLWLALSGSDPADGSAVYSVRLRGHERRRVFESPEAFECLVADPGRRVLHAFPVGGEVRQMLSHAGRLLEELPNPDGLLRYHDGAVLADGNLALAGTARTQVLVEGEATEASLGGLAVQNIRGHLVRTATLLTRDPRGLLLAAGGFDVFEGPGGPRLHFVSGRAIADLHTLAPIDHAQPHGLTVGGEEWGRVAGGDAPPGEAGAKDQASKEEDTP